MADINSQSWSTLNHIPRDLFLNTPQLFLFLSPPRKFIPYPIHRQNLIYLLPHTSSSVSIKPMATCLDTSRREAKQNPDRRIACCRQGVWQSASSGRPPLCQTQTQTPQNPIDPHLPPNGSGGRYPTGYIWQEMLVEAETDIKQEPILSSYYGGSITSHKSVETALANHLATKLDSSSLPSATLFHLFLTVLREDGGEIIQAVEADLRAVRERDPACISYVHCFLNFKGFLACQAHRIAHKLWVQRRKTVALLIQNRVSEVFAVDIHPGAVIGRGLLLDHATGVVIGETAVIGENVSILHNVTLGGTGKEHGDRHPKIGDGVLIGAGTCVLGNVRVGDGAKIGAGSLVLKDVPARTTAVGNPARLIGGKENPIKLDKIPSFTMDHTSHIQEWSDYVI